MKIEVEKQSQVLCKTITVYGRSAGIVRYALAWVANALAECETDPVVSVRIEMPDYTFKSRLHGFQRMLKETAKEQNLQVAEVVTAKHSAVAVSAVTVTGIAYKSGNVSDQTPAHIARDIVMLGYAGMEGMLRILDEKEMELKQRFSGTFLKQIRGYEPYVFLQDGVRKAGKLGALKIIESGEGGVFATIWNMALDMESGVELDFKKIQVLQETVEVCEQYRLNPYQLASAGTFFLIAEDGEQLAEALRQEHLPAVMVGRLTDNNDKILRNGEEIRYVDRPADDEIYKLFRQEEQ